MRIFLYTITALVLAVLLGLLGLRLFADQLTQAALVPPGEFVAPAPIEGNRWRDPAMWFSHPATEGPANPARWQPALSAPRGAAPAPAPAPAPAQPGAEGSAAHAVFFVHPTSFTSRASWNAPIEDAASQERARLLVRGMASPFNQATQIWAPRYRQATFGAFLIDTPEAERALDAAYGDVLAAFEVFLASVPADMPLVLAGHSQGAYHVIRLLAERIAGTAIEARIAMAYPIGWPISVEHDLPALGLPACTTAAQAGCIASWASFAEPAEPGQFLHRYALTRGFAGPLRANSAILCTNPLTGTAGDAAGRASAARNLGTLVPSADLSTGELIPGAVPAACNRQGLLLIGDPPELGPYVLPGNNYHVYDIALFWANLRADVRRRVAAFAALQPGQAR